MGRGANGAKAPRPDIGGTSESAPQVLSKLEFSHLFRVGQVSNHSTAHCVDGRKEVNAPRAGGRAT